MLLISRKITMAFLMSALIISPLYASTPKKESTFRISLGIAAEHVTTTWKHKINPHKVVRHSTGQFSDTQRSITFSPSLEIGGYAQNNFYLGLITSWRNINATAKSHQTLNNYHIFQHRFEISHSFDALLNCGYKTKQNALIYMKVGPTLTKWSHRTKLMRQNIELNSLGAKKSSLGLALGGGVEFPIFDKVALAFDYTHNFYKSSKVKKTLTVAQPLLGNVTNEVPESVSLSHGTFALRLAYFF